jgi:hypothetical protein
MKTKSKPKSSIIAAALASTMVMAFMSSIVLPQLEVYAISKNVVKGSITSLQNDESGKSAWIVSGVFRVDNMSSNSPTLNAAFYMIKKDGTAPHTHTISDFIKIMDDSAVSIWLDPSKTKGHFGNTVIYGTQHLICVEKPQYCK